MVLQIEGFLVAIANNMSKVFSLTLPLVLLIIGVTWSNMAAHADAAASLSPVRTVFSCFLSCKSQCFCTSSSRLPVFKRAYSREFLLDVGRTTFLELNSAHAEDLRDLGLLRRPTPSPTPTTASRPQRRRYKWHERKQKRGKHGGIRARLAANPHKPAIPTIVLANVRSLDNKLDYIRLLHSTQRTVRDCCVFVFTETWLNNSVPDCITVWYGACNASCRKSLQWIVRAAEKIVGVSLPSLQDIYSTRLTRKALSIAGDPTHPSHSFFSLLPSGRRLRSLQARTNRLKDSFIYQAVRKLNSLPSLPPLPSLTPRTTELWPHPHTHTPTHPHTHTHTYTHTHTVTSTSHFVQHWTDLIQLPLLTVWIKTALFVTLNRIDLISSLHYTIYILHCLFISLVCTLSTMCLMPLYLFFIIIIIFFYFYFFLHVLICIFVIVAFCVCMYVYTYMYIYIYMYACMYVYTGASQ